eukprot:CAMPEP_0177789492 /NCGR_PEP_ID=MMETSP0491_2-20121128/22783_1 /TAXON_ID=63592 /ORGANISM="Tetraselmis chuii, Strain PLY429" /LENGTH=59 /DNA_ID=CAMNT_0019311369 /DNA_START=20 /DNA_END=196 /DNA_ORIENTATION=+
MRETVVSRGEELRGMAAFVLAAPPLAAPGRLLFLSATVGVVRAAAAIGVIIFPGYSVHP